MKIRVAPYAAGLSAQMKIVFDIDNTLYSFRATGFGDVINGAIVAYLRDTLGLSHEEAIEFGRRCYHTYGLTALGVLKEFGDKVNIREFCRFSLKHCEYTKLAPIPQVSNLLERLQGDGHDLWIMTNADMQHARDVLDRLQVTQYFTATTTADLTTASPSPSPQLKGYDCFEQWSRSDPPMQNKPMKGPYEAIRKQIDGSLPHSEFVMVEDSLINLEAPHQLGWKTVWISNGDALPQSSTFVPSVIVDNVWEMESFLLDLQKGAKNN